MLLCVTDRLDMTLAVDRAEKPQHKQTFHKLITDGTSISLSLGVGVLTLIYKLITGLRSPGTSISLLLDDRLLALV